MNFNAIAPFYEFIARGVFGDSLRRARWALLADLPQLSEVLVVGGGTGELLMGWAHERLPDHIDYLEPSYRMMQLARRRWEKIAKGKSCQIKWLQKEVEQWEAHKQYDGLATCFVLDLFEGEELSGILKRLHQQLGPGGYWLYVDFCGDRPWKRLLIRGMYQFFAWTTGLKTKSVTDVVPLLEQLGYREVEKKTFRRGLIQAVLLQKPACGFNSVHP